MVMCLNHSTTVLCHYTVVIFLTNPYKMHPMAGELGGDMECVLWVQTLIYNWHQSLQ